MIQLGCTLTSENETSLKTAARIGHNQVVEYLLYCGGNPNVKGILRKSWTARIPFFSGKKFSEVRDVKIKATSASKKYSLLIDSVKKDNRLLVQLLMNESDIPISPTIIKSGYYTSNPRIIVESKVLHKAFHISIEQNSLEMARLLIEKGAESSVNRTKALFTKANIYRIFVGSRRKYQDRIALMITALNPRDFDRLSPVCVKACSEIGCIEGMRACIARQADINDNNGLALYASIYCGNIEMTAYIISEGVNVMLFGPAQKMFCTSLLFVEGLSIVLFMLLVILWLSGLLSGEITSDLTGMVIPTALAIVIMYRLVPFHRVVKGLILVENAQKEFIRNNGPLTA